MEQLAKAISSGSLRGARGNSGVILSQLLRGFTKEIQGTASIDVTILANAMVRGTETAYKAVMNQGRHHSYGCQGHGGQSHRNGRSDG